MKFSKPSLTSLIYSQVSFQHVYIKIELKHLIPFLSFISDKKSKFCGDQKFGIFKDLELLKKEKWENYTSKVRFNIDSKYTLKTDEFVKRFAMEVKYYKALDLQKLLRCTVCNILLPHPFINPDRKSPYLIKPFKEKVNAKFYIYISKFLFDKDFTLKEIKNTEDLENAFELLGKQYEKKNKKNTVEFESISEIVSFISTIRHTPNNEEIRMKMILSSFHDVSFC